MARICLKRVCVLFAGQTSSRRGDKIEIKKEHALFNRELCPKLKLLRANFRRRYPDFFRFAENIAQKKCRFLQQKKLMLKKNLTELRGDTTEGVDF